MKQRFSRKVRDATNAEYDEAAFPGMSMKKLEYIRKAKFITDQWERSCKLHKIALLLRGKLEPMVVPRDHSYFPVYHDALLTLESCSTA